MWRGGAVVSSVPADEDGGSGRNAGKSEDQWSQVPSDGQSCLSLSMTCCYSKFPE